MKKLTWVAVLSLLLVSCKKDADVFTGDYSYKTSGVVEITTTSDSTVRDVALSNKIGSMSIERLNSGSTDSVLVVKNELGGGVQVLRAKSTGDSLYFKPHTRTFTIALIDTISGSTISSVEYTANVDVVGNGQIYDNSIVITEQYSGTIKSSSSDEVVGTLTGKDILTVATSNN